MSEATIDVVEGNKLIAVFDGWEVAGNRFEKMEQYGEDGKNQRGVSVKPDVLNYHENWNLLMPVVEKISRIVAYKDENQEVTHYPRTFGMLSDEGKPMVRLHACPVFIANTLIEAAYNAVVDFIKWYNTRK